MAREHEVFAGVFLPDTVETSVLLPAACIVCGAEARTFFEWEYDGGYTETQSMGGMGGIKSITRRYPHEFTLKVPYCGVRHGPREGEGRVVGKLKESGAELWFIYLVGSLGGMVLGMLVASGQWPNNIVAMLLGGLIGLALGTALFSSTVWALLRLRYGSDRTEWPLMTDRGFYFSVSEFSAMYIKLRIGFSSHHYTEAFRQANQDWVSTANTDSRDGERIAEAEGPLGPADD